MRPEGDRLLSLIITNTKRLFSQKYAVENTYDGDVVHLLGLGKVMGSILGPNIVIAQTLKGVPTAAMSDARH